jgi:hypothetical protein
VEQFAPSLTVTCPAHGGQDRVRRVSAVYPDAASGPPGPGRLLVSANRLAWAGTVCGVIGAVLVSIRAAIGGGAASGPLVVVAAVCFGYAIACYGLAAARRVSVFLVLRRPAAEREQAVWYCERCNAVFTEQAGFTEQPG